MRKPLKPVPPAALIGRHVVRNLLDRSHLVIVPNCCWTGYECDLLVVTKDLRLIDIEIKRSAADTKRDLQKDKWWLSAPGHWRPDTKNRQGTPTLDWPPRIWKHWFVVTETAWNEGLHVMLPPASGVAIFADGSGKVVSMPSTGLLVHRKPKPNTDAKPITAANAIDIARLASLRLWEEYMRQDQADLAARMTRRRAVLINEGNCDDGPA